MSAVLARPLTAEAFAPYGEMVAPGDVTPVMINAGECARFTDLARLEAEAGKIGLSLFQANVRDLPVRVDLLERHPLGSQCFIPVGGSAFVVVVAPDAGGKPGAPEVFLAGPHQPVNIARNVWHGVLAPVSGTGQFVVIDRIGEGANLEEFVLPEPLYVTAELS